MKEQGTSPTVGDKQTGPAAAPFTTSGPAWNGWGVDLGNSRFQTAQAAALTGEQTPRCVYALDAKSGCQYGRGRHAVRRVGIRQLRGSAG